MWAMFGTLVIWCVEFMHRISAIKTQPVEDFPVHQVVSYPAIAGRIYPVGLTQIDKKFAPTAALQQILPFLSALTRQRKWVILVNPSFVMPAKTLSEAGIVPGRFMIVRARSPEGQAWAVQQALRNSPGGAVLYWSRGTLESSLCRRIEAAAQEGESSCIAFISCDNALIEINKAA